MEAWQERVIAEAKELEERLKKLSDFLSRQDVAEMHPTDRGLLARQLVLMDVYYETLQHRIHRFKTDSQATPTA